MSLKGKRNSYCCKTCGGIVFTVDTDEGVTPFMMECRATEDCEGTMESAFYRLPLQASKVRAHYEWRKPSQKEYAQMTKPMQEHIDKGGLDLYALPPTGHTPSVKP